MSEPLRIGWTVGDERDRWTPTAMAALIAAGHVPVAVVSAFPLDPKAKARRVAGDTYRAAKAKIAGGVAHERDALLRFARDLGLPDDDTMDHVGSFCAARGIPIQHVPDINSDEAVRAVQDHRIDVLVNGGGGLFRKGILSAPRLGLVNLHLGPLPHYRGYNVSEWTLFDAAQAGVTAHFVDVGLDTGDILHFEPIDPLPWTDLPTFRAALGPHKIKVLLKVVAGLSDGSVTPRPQPRSAGKQHYAMHPRLKELLHRRLVALTGHHTA